ncbi:hypothetical protein PVK06_045520 [Gossypium arboreum]|uniref:Plastocyanin-like domain-containing protein n=1 Tax=Gossypium arboreum TaxID=29729 RepID=A0ABR0MUA0_GOSAR|nr:hypothetical protein PVK06_045520 [Gossypium arboreum]
MSIRLVFIVVQVHKYINSHHGPPKTEISVINGTFRGFIEVILQNNNTKVQTYHLSGYVFFVVGKEFVSSTNHV